MTLERKFGADENDPGNITVEVGFAVVQLTVGMSFVLSNIEALIRGRDSGWLPFLVGLGLVIVGAEGLETEFRNSMNLEK